MRNAQVVEQMYALLAQYDVKAPSEDMVQVDDLRTIQVRRSEKIDRRIQRPVRSLLKMSLISEAPAF